MGRAGALGRDSMSKSRMQWGEPASCAEDLYATGRRKGAGPERASRGQLRKKPGWIPRAMGNHNGFQQQNDLVRLTVYEGALAAGGGRAAGQAKRR